MVLSSRSFNIKYYHPIILPYRAILDKTSTLGYFVYPETEVGEEVLKKSDKEKSAAQRRRMHQERTGRSPTKKSTFEPSDLIRDSKESFTETEGVVEARTGFFGRALDLFTKGRTKGV